jgi:hypothetical protein
MCPEKMRYEQEEAEMDRREAVKVTGQIVGATLLIPRQELLSRLSIALNKPSSGLSTFN